jgi:hypothetical protein
MTGTPNVFKDHSTAPKKAVGVNLWAVDLE